MLDRCEFRGRLPIGLNGCEKRPATNRILADVCRFSSLFHLRIVRIVLLFQSKCSIYHFEIDENRNFTMFLVTCFCIFKFSINARLVIVCLQRKIFYKTFNRYGTFSFSNGTNEIREEYSEKSKNKCNKIVTKE